VRKARVCSDLLDQRGLAGLARAGQHLDKAAGLCQTPGKLAAMMTGIHGLQFTQ